MEYKDWEMGEIPEYALQPAKPASERSADAEPAESRAFDASVYDRLFSEMTELQESSAMEAKEENEEMRKRKEASEEGENEGLVLTGTYDMSAETEAAPLSGFAEEPEVFRMTAAESSAMPSWGEEAPEPVSVQTPVRMIPAGEDALRGELPYTDVKILPSAKVRIEEDLLVPDVRPDLAAILLVEGRSVVPKNEYSLGNERHNEVRINGELALQVLYSPLGDPKPIVALTASVPFRSDVSVPGAAEGQVCVYSQIDRLEWEVINERKYRIKADVSLELRAFCSASLELFRGVKGKNVQLRKEPVTLTTEVIRKRDSLELREILQKKEGRGQIGEILSWTAEPVELHRQISEEKAMISGLIRCSVLYCTMDGGEEETPELFRDKIEFTQFISLNSGEGRTPISENRVCLSLENVELKVEEDEGGSRNRFCLTGNLVAELELYREETAEAVTDLYDVDQEVRYDAEKAPVFRWKGSGVSETGIRGSDSVPDSAGEIGQILFLSGRPVLSGVETENGKCTVEGIVDAAVLCGGEGGKAPFCLHRELPFRCTVSVPEATEGMKAESCVLLKDLWFERTGNRQIELNGSLSVTVSVYTEGQCPLVRNLVFLDRNEAENRPSVVVCMTGEQDTEWSVAKRYRVPLAALREINGLSEGAFLEPGRKLMIVR